MHKQYIKISVGFLIGGTILLIMIGASIAKTAQGEGFWNEPIANQPIYQDTGTFNANNTNQQFIQQLGSGHTGTIQKLTYKTYATTTVGVTSQTNLVISSIDTANTTDMALYAMGTTTGMTTITSYDAPYTYTNCSYGSGQIGVRTCEATTATGTSTLDSSRTYFIRRSGGLSSREIVLLGSNIEYDGGTINPLDTGIDNMFMLYEGYGGSTIDGYTKIISLITPTSDETTASSTINFQYTYYINSEDTSLTFTGIEIKDAYTGQSYQTLPEEFIDTYDTTLIYSATTTVAEGHYHQWRAYIRNESEVIYTSPWKGFWVVTADELTELPTIGLDYVSTSSVSVAGFGIIPLLQTTIPFSYIYQINTIIQDISETPTGDFPTLTITTGASSTVPLSVNFFSASTTETYLSDSNRLMFRTLLEIMLWVSLMTMIFFTIKRQF